MIILWFRGEGVNLVPAGTVTDIEVTGIPHGVRSEALECVRLAAAFACASLLALLPDAPASWRLVHSTGVPTVKRLRYQGRKRASGTGVSTLRSDRFGSQASPRLFVLCSHMWGVGGSPDRAAVPSCSRVALQRMVEAARGIKLERTWTQAPTLVLDLRIELSPYLFIDMMG